MPIVQHNPPELFPRYRCYTHATEVRGDSRLLIISGLNGYMQDGRTMPESFEEQADLIWTHLQTLLRSAGMTVKTSCRCGPILPIRSTTSPTSACGSSIWAPMRPLRR